MLLFKHIQLRGLFVYYISLSFFALFYSSEVIAQCPSAGCTITISGADASPYTINAGQKLCITATGNYTGTITMNGGTLDNCANTLQTFILLYSGVTTSVVNNYGQIQFSNMDIDQGVFNNYGSIIETNGMDVRNTAILNNYDSIWVGNDFITRLDGKLNNYGYLDIGNNFDQLDNSYIENFGTIISGSRFKCVGDFYNSGNITVGALWDNLTPGNTFTNDGGCVTATNWDNKKSTIGINCGTITIVNNSNNTASGIVDGNIAIVDNPAYPFFDSNSGIVGASVIGVSCGCPGALDNCKDTISGIVFNDFNADALIDPADSLLDSIAVQLYHDINGNGIIDGADSILTSALTDSLGYYKLTFSSYQTVSTFSKRVGFGEDDSYETLSTGVTKNNDKLKIGDHGSIMSVGVRFRDVNIPKSAYVTNSYVEFDAHDGQSGLMQLAIFGEAEDSADVYANGPLYDISGRNRTIDSVLWNENTNWVQDFKYRSDDISVLVQEILDRPGWYTGNPMAFMFNAYAATGKRNAKDWNEDAAKAPLLKVTYIDSLEFIDYLVIVDETTLPAGFTYSTDSVFSGSVSCGSEPSPSFIFGIVTTEICNDGIDNDGDGLIDCADTLDCRPAQPGTITVSNDTICEGSTGESYSISAVAGATSYDWTVPLGATIGAGQGTTTISVDWGSTSGSVCVRSYNGFCYSAFNCIAITVNTPPAIPSPIFH